MNILLDFIPLQYAGGVGGAASFTKVVSDNVIKNKKQDNIYAIFDSRLSVGKQYNYKEYSKENNIILLDRAHNKIGSLIDKYQINTWFISIAQFYEDTDLSDINCKIIMFIHDIFDVERNDNKIDLMLLAREDISVAEKTKRIISLISGRWKHRAKKKYNNILKLYTAKNTISYTVSEYSREAIYYYFNIQKNIRICYSPRKEVYMEDSICNNTLKSLIESHTPYLLFLGGKREYKNINVLLKILPNLIRDFPQLKLLTLNYKNSNNGYHINIDFLSDSDLEYAYKNASALIFASFFEGFGYPPIEAMKYKTPIIASNVTSIPEILKDSVFYFSPFYPVDLYKSIKYALNSKDVLIKKMENRLVEIKKQQEKDLNLLINEIYSK